MGTYDFLRCCYPLPLAQAQAATFQTRELCNQLDEFTLREDGSLWRQAYDTVEAPLPASGLTRAFCSTCRENFREEPYPYTGSLDFYGEYGAHSLSPGNAGWLEMRARFDQGQLVDLVVLNHTPSLNERLRQEKLTSAWAA